MSVCVHVYRIHKAVWRTFAHVKWWSWRWPSAPWLTVLKGKRDHQTAVRELWRELWSKGGVSLKRSMKEAWKLMCQGKTPWRVTSNSQTWFDTARSCPASITASTYIKQNIIPTGCPMEPVFSGWHGHVGCNKWGPTPRVHMWGLREGLVFSWRRCGLSVILLILIRMYCWWVCGVNKSINCFNPYLV